jgi:hypothetical protein
MELCIYYPTDEDLDNYGGVCWAGSEVSDNPCTKEDSEICPWKKETDEINKNYNKILD